MSACTLNTRRLNIRGRSHDFGTPCPKRVCLAAVEDGIAQTLVGALHVLASTTALLNPKPNPKP